MDFYPWLLCSRLVQNPYLLYVEHILEGSNAKNLMKMQIMSSLFDVGGLIEVEVPFEVLCFDANGMSAFQARVKFETCKFFLTRIHCKTRKTNLAI
jgi:hypothetical protein